MATSLSEILYALQNGVRAINELKDQLAISFPPITSLRTTAPSAGTVVYSSLATAFGVVQTSSGGTYRIALLPST